VTSFVTSPITVLQASIDMGKLYEFPCKRWLRSGNRSANECVSSTETNWSVEMTMQEGALTSLNFM